MDRQSLAALTVALVLACNAHQARAADIKIEAGSQSVKVQTASLKGIAQRVSYDDAKAVLLLEGTKDTPVILVRNHKGQRNEVRAIRIIYSLKDESYRADGVVSSESIVRP